MLAVEPIQPAEIERDWADIAMRLWPAVRQSPGYDLEGLRQRLLGGSAMAFRVLVGGDGLWVVSADQEGPELILWTVAIAGRIEGGPKARLMAMRAALEAIEKTGRLAGCAAHRICGRDYSRLFPDYAPFEGARNGLEKRL